MYIDYTALTAWAALVASLIAIAAIWVEGRRNRSSRAIDLVLRFDDEFDTEQFRLKRRKTATELLKGIEISRDSKVIEDAEDILNHFEIIGVLLKRRVLELYLVDVIFSYYVCGYYPLLRHIVEREIKAMPYIWEDAQWLYEQLAAYDYKPFWEIRKYYLIRKIADQSKEENEIFLKLESKL